MVWFKAKVGVDVAETPVGTSVCALAIKQDGLSMIYGFARPSGGHVRIYTEIGPGRTVCIYLPR